MKKKYFIYLLSLFIPVTFLFGVHNSSASNQLIEQKRYIITLATLSNDEISPKSIVKRFDFQGQEVIVAELSSEELLPLIRNPKVLSIEEDKIINVDVASNRELGWTITQLNVNKSWASSIDGKGINIAILDTGIQTNHEDLSISGGISFIGPSWNYADDNGHGTHIAGIIGAQHNNIGIDGLAPKANIYAVKVLDQFGNGYLSSVLEGINWAMENNMDIINMSFGTNVYSPMLEVMINEAISKGIFVVAASGNEGTKNINESTISFPGNYKGVVTVGAVDSSLKRPTFSGTGENLNFVAPGVNIYSLSLNNGYEIMSGTSMATAYVSGIIALIKDFYPEFNHNDVLDYMKKNSIDLGVAGFDSEYGHGLVQAPYLSFINEKRFKPIQENVSLYDNSSGNLVKVGQLKKGQSYSMVSEVGNWLKVQYGRGFAYVWKFSAVPIRYYNDVTMQPAGEFISLTDLTVYDNSSGELEPIGIIENDVAYPFVRQVGNWYEIVFLGRVSYVYMPATKRIFQDKDKYFKVEVNDLSIYDNSSGDLVKVGSLKKGQVFERAVDYGNWHKIKYGDFYAYVWKWSTSSSDNKTSVGSKFTYTNFFISKKKLTVYDNSLGELIPIATIDENVKYPYLDEVGNWYKIFLSGRIGYVYKPATVKYVDKEFKCFRPLVEKLPVFKNGSGELVEVGSLKQGEYFSMIRDVGNWYEIQFDSGVGYVWKRGTGSCMSLNKSESLIVKKGQFIPLTNITVYDNSSGELKPFAVIYKGIQYSFTKEYGNWYEIQISNRVGYVYKHATIR